MRFYISFAVVMLVCAVLGGLGFWQLQRMEWKLDLISRIATQTGVDAKTVDLTAQLDNPDSNLSRGNISGRFLPGKNVRVGPRTQDGMMGYWIITPLKLVGGRIVMVNRGFVPDFDIQKAMQETPKARLMVLGTLRLSDQRGAPVAGDPHSWHHFDAAGIAAALKLENVAPMVVFMENTPYTPAPVLTSLRNEHLNYAIFWFTLAVILFAGFCVFSLRGRRLVSSPGPSNP